MRAVVLHQTADCIDTAPGTGSPPPESAFGHRAAHAFPSDPVASPQGHRRSVSFTRGSVRKRPEQESGLNEPFASQPSSHAKSGPAYAPRAWQIDKKTLSEWFAERIEKFYPDIKE